MSVVKFGRPVYANALPLPVIIPRAHTTDVPMKDLTPEMLQDGSWKTANFRKFNLDAEPKVGYSTHNHPPPRPTGIPAAYPTC